MRGNGSAVVSDTFYTVVQHSPSTSKVRVDSHECASRSLRAAFARHSACRVLAAFAIALAGAACPGTLPQARAEIVIAFTAVDMQDADPLHDSWRYDYRVSGFAFEAGARFTIDFPGERYADPELASVPIGWSAFVFPADPLSGPAQLLAVSDAGDAAPERLFAVQFTWLGAGAPDSQPLTVYDAELNLVSAGLTTAETPPVPEPGAALLTSIGLLLLVLLYRRRFAAVASTA